MTLRALDIRDRTYGQQPQTQQMRTGLLAFGQVRKHVATVAAEAEVDMPDLRVWVDELSR